MDDHIVEVRIDLECVVHRRFEFGIYRSLGGEGYLRLLWPLIAHQQDNVLEASDVNRPQSRR